MNPQRPTPEQGRQQLIGEEIANSVSHAVGLLAALAATPLLLRTAMQHDDVLAIIGAIVFAVSVVLLYLTSTLYHALARNRAKTIFRVLDHCAIYFLIAGTYTPFTLGILRGAWGWTLFGLIWGIAFAGVALKSLRGMSFPKLSVALYLGMGWLAIIAIRPLWTRVQAPGLWLIVAGGLAYSVGIVFFAAEHRRYTHLVWHLFVLAGTCCHFFAVLWYAN